MFDRFGREISYLRISVTERCNLRCVYCRPAAEERNPPAEESVLSCEEILRVIRAAGDLGFRKIRFTGGEPLVRRDLPELVDLTHRAFPAVRLTLTTNGTLLAPVAADLYRKGLESVNISLDTLDPEKYSRVTRGGVLADVLRGIEAAVDAGLQVKLNMVVSPRTGPEEIQAIRSYAERTGVSMQTLQEYRLDQPKKEDTVYDRPPKCSSCNRIRLLAAGVLKPCLHSDRCVPVDFNDIDGSLMRCIRLKPAHGGACSAHAVNRIGG